MGKIAYFYVAILSEDVSVSSTYTHFLCALSCPRREEVRLEHRWAKDLKLLYPKSNCKEKLFLPFTELSSN